MLSLANNLASLSASLLDIIRSGLKMFLPFISNQQLGEELAVNGDFATNSDWTFGDGWSYVNGKASLVQDGSPEASDHLTQQITGLINGITYVISFDLNITSATTTTIGISSSGAFGQLGSGDRFFTTSGTKTITGVYDSSHQSGTKYLRFVGGDNTEFTIDNVSVKEVGQFSLDETTNNNNAKLFTGTALDFDGTNDYVDLGSQSIPNTSTVTFSFWVNPVLSASSSNSAIFRYGKFTAWFRNNDTFRIYTNDAESQVDFSISDLSNKYSRIVISVSGTSLSLYIDGTLIETKTSPSLNTSATTSAIGRYASGVEHYLEGKLSDIQLWNSAWSATDVANDYASPNELVSSVSVSNLKAWWAFTEGSGSFAFDNATAPGSEEVTNGGFATTTAIGTAGSGWSKIVAGDCTVAYANGGVKLTQASVGSQDCKVYAQTVGGSDNLLTVGKQYKVTYEVVSNNNSTSLKYYRGGSYLDINHTVGTHTFYYKQETNQLSIFWNLTANSDITLDNISIKEISAGVINGADYEPAQSSILQLGMINWSNGSNVFLPPSPTNSAQDILGNAVRDRLNSLNLTGTGFAEVADSASINPTSAITIQCWIKSNTENDKGLVAKWKTGAQDYMLYKTSGSFSFYIGATPLAGGAISNTGWVNIAGTYDGSSIKTFINGVQSATSSLTGSIPNGAGPLEIGRYNQNSDKTYSERIDDVKIYDRPLSAPEILQNYKAGTSAHTN